MKEYIPKLTESELTHLSQNPEILLSVNDAYTRVMGIFNEIMMLGANDYEATEISKILNKLGEGVITPEDAVHAAENIRASKMDYH